MGAEGDEDHGSFGKQRRNLILVSLLLIFSTFTTPSGNLALLGITLSGLTQSRILTAVWVLGAYCLLRYWQYLRTEEWIKFKSHLQTEFNQALQNSLPGLFALLLPRDAAPPNDTPGAKLSVVLTGFGVLSNKGNEIRVEASFTRTFERGTKSDIRKIGAQAFVITGWEARRIRFVGAVRAFLLTPAGTEYILPPLLFMLAIISNIGAHWSSLHGALSTFSAA